MRASHYVALGFLAALAILVAVLATVEDVDDFSPYNPLWNGLSKLREAYRASVVSTGDVAGLPPGVLLVIGPSRGFESWEVEVLRGFLERGGVIVVMEDYGGVGYSLASSLGLNVKPFEGALVDPMFYYRDYMLPRVTFWGNISAYFNYGTALREYNGVCIATSSPYSFIDVNGNYVYDSGEPVGPFCVAVEVRVGSGSLILVADSSIAINSMVELNRELLERLLGRGPIYILGDRWEWGYYSLLRAALLSLYTTVTGTQLRYVAVALAIALFPLLARVASTLYTSRVVESLEVEVKALLSRNPSWDVEALRRVLRDLYESRGSKG